ncbi:MAG: hypothetical protein ABSD76_11220 [Terriglobales bacterium]|jgi:hypothetical protein
MKSRISILGALTLRQHLNRFAIATILVGGVLLAVGWPAEAQIVYTPTNITIGLNSSYNLDVNNDGVTDFTITTEDIGYLQPPWLLLNGSVSETSASENGALIGPLSEGDEIGPDQVFSGGTVDLESFFLKCGKQKGATCHYAHSGPWDVHLKGKRYLGLSFQLNGETYYGWAQLTLLIPTAPWEGGVVGAKLSGYAYESTPGMPIDAGQTK